MLAKSPLLSRIPQLRHGFTTKLLSKEENTLLDKTVATAKQVHKADLLWVEKWEKREREADAVATFQKNLGIGVYSADCTPILVAALHEGKAFAILAIHAGWRGTAQQIAKKAFRAFHEKASQKYPPQYFAAIGPCISYQSFEVGEEVVEAFPGAEARGLAKFLRMEGEKRKFLFNLPGENLRQVQEIAAELRAPLEVELLDECTVLEKEKFPSFRRDRENAGRILSFLCMEE